MRLFPRESINLSYCDIKNNFKSNVVLRYKIASYLFNVEIYKELIDVFL